MSSTLGYISAWGNGLALRLTKPMATAAGFVEGTRVQVHAQPGRIAIEIDAEPSLDEMLARFDPRRHGGDLKGWKESS